jgi:hypothetical protein
MTLKNRRQVQLAALAQKGGLQEYSMAPDFQFVRSLVLELSCNENKAGALLRDSRYQGIKRAKNLADELETCTGGPVPVQGASLSCQGKALFLLRSRRGTATATPRGLPVYL